MKARELVELAALVAAHGPLIVTGEQRLSDSGLQDYWTASKCRFDRWGRALRAFRDELDAARGGSLALARWQRVQPVLEEVLTGEVLARVWAAVVCAHDRIQGRDDGDVLVRSVLIGQMEARHRVLTLLAREEAQDAMPARTLNQLRRRCERWTDLLIGYLVSRCDVSEFAFERERALDFADSLESQRRAGVGEPAWQLTLSSLRAAFLQLVPSDAPNADLNQRLAAAILASFPAELFEDTGLMRRLWIARLQHTTTDAQCLIDDLIKADEADLPAGEIPVRHARF